MKECVKIKVTGEPSLSLQKRILIYDLPDLYKNWVKDSGHQNVPCLAFFTQMRPKQCVFAGDPGTHNICVCFEHQNVKLKLSAIKPDINYKEVIETGVCSIESKCCMLKQCHQCPKESAIRQLLCFNIDIQSMTNVEYSNWASIPLKCQDSGGSSSTRVTLKNFIEPVNEFLNNLTKNIWDLTDHHFISWNQKEYFVATKSNLNKNTALFIMDFAENYTFICQNSTQGFYFHNTHATLFNVTLYYKEQSANKLEVACFCIISNTSTDQAYSVHIFMECVIDKIKTEFPWIKSLIYFSDGAPTQFKNK